jgi:hypothetical protein
MLAKTNGDVPVKEPAKEQVRYRSSQKALMYASIVCAVFGTFLMAL